MMMNYVIMTMILTHQTAGDAEPDPRIPHPPQMKSPHPLQIKVPNPPQMKSAQPPQMKAPLESISQTEAQLFLAKANMRFWFKRHGLIGIVHAGEFQNFLHSNKFSEKYKSICHFVMCNWNQQR